VLLSLDISTAFDMLDHDCLLNRATEFFEIYGQDIDWLKSKTISSQTEMSDKKIGDERRL